MMALDSQTKRELELLNPTATNFPNKIDVLTPHKISVALLIQQYLKIKQSNDDLTTTTTTTTTTPTTAPTTTAQLTFASYSRSTRRKFCMLLLKLIQFPDMTYKDLHNILSLPKYRIDQNHFESFEKCMSELNSLGIEYLLDSFDMQNVLDKILGDNSGINQFGIVGLYIRRIVVTLDKMSFPEMKALYKSISLYYEKGVRELAISAKEPTNQSHTDDDNSDIGEDLDSQKVHRERNTQSKWSIKQAELFISQQCLLLENNELKALPPIELQSKLNEILNDNPLYSPGHFVTYMNNLRLRDYFSSLESLYRTFDRNPVQNCGASNGSVSSSTKGFQYSSLNLAIMHAGFNHKTEALRSLKECVMLAQEGGDKQCLDLANAWYCILNEKIVNPQDKVLPDPNDLTMIELLTLTIQFIAKLASSCGYRPADLFQMLLKSDKINSRNSLIEYTTSCLAIRAALWTLYGCNELSSVCAQMLLKLKKTWMFGDFSNSESVCQVLCSLALWLTCQGEYNLAAVMLYHAKERFPRDPLSSSWMVCECHISISQAINKCQWQTAMKYCCQLYIFNKNSSILQRSSIYIARRNMTVARQLLDHLLETKDLDSLTRVQALIFLAYSMINSETEISPQIYTVLSDAAAISKDEYLEYDAAHIDMIFAFVLLNTNQPSKAFEIINNEKCLEVILANGGIYDKAKCYFLFIKCLIASTLNNNEKMEKLSNNMEIINDILVYFKKLENHAKVLDVYVWLANQFNEFKVYSERNKYACKFKNYYNEFNVPVEYLNVFY